MLSKQRTKLVFIAKCEDCPVTCCENRVPCGLIPETCQLEDADQASVATHPEAVKHVLNNQGE